MDQGAPPGQVNAVVSRAQKASAASPRVGFVALLAVLVSACPQTDAGRDLGRQWIEAMNSHDANRVITLLAPTATYSDPATPAPLAIPDFRVRLQRDWAAWKDRVYLARRIVPNNGTVVVEWQMLQTHANGEPVPLDGVTVLDTHDGRITAVRDYYNASIYLRFLLPPHPQ